MNTESTGSEVAAIRASIELECQALNLLRSGTATVAAHRIISEKFAYLDARHEELSRIVGEAQAIQIVVDIYDQAVQ